MDGVYITADTIGSAGGGGQVVFNESTALREFCGRDITVIGGQQLKREPYQGLDLPFLWDYFAVRQSRQGT